MDLGLAELFRFDRDQLVGRRAIVVQHRVELRLVVAVDGGAQPGMLHF
jgi:hypothetical protein